MQQNPGKLKMIQQSTSLMESKGPGQTNRQCTIQMQMQQKQKNQNENPLQEPRLDQKPKQTQQSSWLQRKCFTVT